MTPHERAERLCIEAEKLGMDGSPSQNMIAAAIHDAECDALNFPHRCNSLGAPSDFILSVKLAVGRLAENLAYDMDHREKDYNKWYKAVKQVRKYLEMEI